MVVAKPVLGNRFTASKLMCWDNWVLWF